MKGYPIIFNQFCISWRVLFVDPSILMINTLIRSPIQTFTKELAGEGCPHGVMVKAMDCGIVVSEFVLQSRYYVLFRANTFGKGMNPLILPAMG